MSPPKIFVLKKKNLKVLQNRINAATWPDYHNTSRQLQRDFKRGVLGLQHPERLGVLRGGGDTGFICDKEMQV